MSVDFERLIHAYTTRYHADRLREGAHSERHGVGRLIAASLLACAVVFVIGFVLGGGL